MPLALRLLLIFWGASRLPAQVFHAAVPPASALALGLATLAEKNTDVGLQNEAILPLLENRWQLMGSAALPYSLGEWKTSHFTVAFCPDRRNGLALSFDQSGIANYREQRWRMGYGRRLAGHLSIGISIDFYRIGASGYLPSLAASTACAMWGRLLPDVSFAVRVQNPFFLKMGEHFLPVIFQTGIQWRLSAAVRWMSEIEKTLGNAPLIKSGVQYQISPRWMLRLGARIAPGQFSLGWGMNISKTSRIDFAMAWHPALGITPAGGIVWVAGNTAPERTSAKR